MILCILLALGGNLVDGPGPGPGSAKLGLKTTAAIIFGRLVLVPPTELGIVTLSDKLGFLPPGDKMFRFVLLLQHTMPTSVLFGAVANLRGCGKEAGSILFWVHIFAVFSMAGWITLYLNTLLSQIQWCCNTRILMEKFYSSSKIVPPCPKLLLFALSIPSLLIVIRCTHYVGRPGYNYKRLLMVKK